MSKSNYIKYLSVSLLIYLMVGCQRPPLDSKNNSSTVKISSSPIIQQQFNDLNLVLSAYKDFKKSINTFNADLKSFVNGNLQERKLNFSEPNNKLIKLQEVILNFKKQINPINNNSELYQSIDKIDKTIIDIAKIIKPLEKGLTSPTIREVQSLIELEKNTGIAPTGIFKTTTQRELEKFLSQKINSLDQEFEQINEIIQKQKNVPESFINNSNPQLLVAQNSALEEQIIISKSEIDNLYKLVNLTVSITIIGFIISGGLLAWLFYKLNMIETSQNTGNSSNNHTELGSMENHIESKFTQIARYLENLDTRLKKLEISPQSPSGSKNIPINNQSLNPPVKTIINHPKSQQGNIYPSGISMSNKEIQIVTVYNNRPRSLSANAITVAENDRTVEQRRIGGSVAPILEENSLGNYWIVQEGNNEYLVPKANIKINEYNYETISSCFECLGYNPSYSSNFTLLKPATVSSIGQNWQLIELGKLQF